LLSVIEPPMIDVAIQHHHGQCAAAARQLGMHRTTLRKKLTEYEVGSDGTS
jgi:DNA-binding protein Fis